MQASVRRRGVTILAALAPAKTASVVPRGRAAHAGSAQVTGHLTETAGGAGGGFVPAAFRSLNDTTRVHDRPIAGVSARAEFSGHSLPKGK